jgi:hypothetical protein
MTPRKQLSLQARYNSESAYFRAIDRRTLRQQANPVIVATASGRDSATGQTLATTLGGGEERLATLTTASLEQGAVLPSVVRGANQGAVDKKPF